MPTKIILAAVLLVAITSTAIAQKKITIGTVSSDTTALLEVNANNKGVLIPRLTNAQMIAIVTPANGLLLYNTDSAAFAYRNATAWVFLKGNATASNNWNTKGNAGTDSSKNFIGTTDNVDLIFKRNNEQAGWLNEALKNTSLGAGSLSIATTGFNNTATGYRALKNNSIGYNNTAIGGQALGSNNIGSRNTATGFAALYSNISGNENAANGTQALLNNIDGSSNIAIGFQSLFSNGSGFSNVAIGAKALSSNTSRSNLVAIGDSALYNNGTGATVADQAIRNTAVGSKALYSNTTGSNNTASGNLSLYFNTTGSRNTAYGYSSLLVNKTGNNNTAYGYQSLYVNTGSSNTASGYQSLFFNRAGNNNTAMGNFAGLNNTDGSSNVFVGYQAGKGELGSNKLYISNAETDAGNTLLYGEFDNKILSIGGKLGIGTTAPETLLHLKNANTDATASQLIIEGNADGAGATVAAIEFRSHFAGGIIFPSGRIRSNLAEMAFQSYKLGPGLTDALILRDGNVGIGISPGTFPMEIKADDLSELIKLYNAAGIPKWHMSLIGTGSLNFVETDVADYRLVLGLGGEVGVGKIPLTTNDDSRLQIKQKGTQNGIGVEAPNNTNHWDLYVTDAVASNFALYYNGTYKGLFDNVTGAYTSPSDRRLKKDITPQQAVLNNVMQLQAYQYHYLDNKTTDRFSNGFMAQDVQKIFPDAVVENEMKDGQTRLGINYQYFTLLAIKGLQEQQQQIQSLEQRLAKLEAKSSR